MTWYTLEADATRMAMESVGGPMRLVVGAADSKNALTVVEQRLDDPGGPPLHVHDDHDEVLMVIQGGPLTIQIGEERLTVEEGGTAFIPRGTPHSFSNLSGAPLRMLGISTPGGIEVALHEQAKYLKGLRGAPEMARIAAIWEGRGRVVGPPIG